MDSKSPFLYVANNLAIDFVNTTIQKFGIPYELLNNKSDLLLWVKSAGINLQTQVAEIDLKNIYQFREALKTLFEAKMQNSRLPESAIIILNSHLKNAPTQQQLEQNTASVELQPLNAHLSVSEVLGEIARQAALILVSTNNLPIKSCASEKCILMFLDTSKAKKRRWCSMEICGNRAKAATYYQSAKPE